MKMLKFKKILADMVLSWTKNTTWRLFDDKDLSEGDELSLLVQETLAEFAKVRITSVRETTFDKLSQEDWDGHERFASEEEMYAIYSGYYAREVTGQSPVKIIKFEKSKPID